MFVEGDWSQSNTDKRKRVLRAALREFTRHGYVKASTNRMVSDAGISKGLLFYYFPSKAALFRYLVEHSLDVVAREYVNQLPSGSTDIVTTLSEAARVKMRAYAEYSDEFLFLGAVLIHSEPQVPATLLSRIRQTQQAAYAQLFAQVDSTSLRKDIDASRAMQLIRWSMDGYVQELMNSLRGRDLTTLEVDDYWLEFDEYLWILRRIFYQPEEG